MSNANKVRDLIAAGALAEGEVVRYVGRTGVLMLVGRAREGGIEVADRAPGAGAVLSLSAFEAAAGSNLRRPAANMYALDGESLQALAGGSRPGSAALGAARAAAAAAPPPPPAAAEPVLEDENDEFCHVCSQGGDLLCCETCPAVFHTACAALEALPEADWHCPACVCAACGGAPPAGAPARPGAAWVPVADGWVGPAELARRHGAPHLAAAAPRGAPSARLAGEGRPAADFGPLVGVLEAALASAVAGGVRSPEPVADAAGDGGAVVCAASGRWRHVACVPEAQRRQRPWFGSGAAASVSLKLAALAGAGALPLGAAAGGLPLALLVVRGAAVAAPADCAGYAPAYSEAQRAELRGALSAALAVLRSGYEELADSRTGRDVLPWLLRGARFEPPVGAGGGGADFSGFHAALLLAGGTVVSAACFRALGPDLAELPLLATRPEARRRGAATLLLAALERALLHAGVAAVVTPAFAAPGVPYVMRPPGTPHPPPAAAGWGYRLAGPSFCGLASRARMLRLPGVLLAAKPLSAATVAPPPPLPGAALLQLDVDTDTRAAAAAGLLRVAAKDEEGPGQQQQQQQQQQDGARASDGAPLAKRLKMEEAAFSDDSNGSE